jgi:hypothetical protein
VFASSITGDVGSSPITGAAIGLNCSEVTGTIYTVNAAGPACRVVDPTRLTAAVGDLETAYTDAAGRTNPDFFNLGAGQIGGLTLTPGLYNGRATRPSQMTSRCRADRTTCGSSRSPEVSYRPRPPT